MNFRTSSYSGSSGGNCVATASGGVVLVRDTTDRAGATLSFPAEAWARFTVSLPGQPPHHRTSPTASAGRESNPGLTARTLRPRS
jgi:hypothetical protein